MISPLIQSNPKIMMGKPIVVGTRITVELILEKLAAGETVEQLLEAHPRLTRPAIQAAYTVEVTTEMMTKSKDVLQWVKTQL